MTNKQIRAEFSNVGVQLGKGSLESIEYELKALVRRMANRCKMHNIKRLTPELMWAALGKNVK